MEKIIPYDTIDDEWMNHRASTPAGFGIKVVQSIQDLMHVFAIRAAVFLAEQTCPFEEEFDGNDFSCTHIVAYKGREPVACLRVRYFADFAKIERLAVRHEHRNTRVSFLIVWAGIELARKKGYTRIYGHAQDRLVKFWSRFGARPMTDRPQLIFSDFSYTEMLLEAELADDAISLSSDPYLIIRPEGAWHRPGVLDASSKRVASSPLCNLQAA